jgi:DNA polymerase-3 subunit epsilon
VTREIVFDTETTGFSPADGDRITEIGCVEVVDFIPTGRTFHTYVNPQRDVPQRVTEITGLTTEFLADKPLFGDVVEAFLDFVEDAPLVAHNAEFDRNFINFELERAQRSVIADERFRCTLVMARGKFPGVRNSLDSLCERFQISLESREKHGALVDAHLLAEVYLELNGGRERSLDLSVGASAAGAALQGACAPRPAPLPDPASADERAAHEAFVAELGEDRLWKLYGT